VAAVLLAAYRIYLDVEDQHGAAVRELDSLAALLSHNSFTDEQSRAELRAKLAGSRVLEGIIITGPGGKELAFEREQGQAIRWSADSPCFIRRFGLVSLPAKPVDVAEMRNVNIYSIYNAINYPDVTGILKQALLIILAALLVAFLALIIVSTAGGTAQNRARNGVAVKFEESLKHKREKKKKEKDAGKKQAREDDKEDLFLTDEEAASKETKPQTADKPALFPDETDDFDFTTFDDGSKTKEPAPEDTFSFDDFDDVDDNEQKTEAAVDEAETDEEDLPEFDGTIKDMDDTGEDDLPGFDKEISYDIDDLNEISETELPDFGKEDTEDTVDEDDLLNFDIEGAAALETAENNDFVPDDFFNEKEPADQALPSGETAAALTAAAPDTDANAAGGPRGLFSPASSIGWEEYTRDRLTDELHRCASTEQDLVVMFVECGEKVPCTGEFYKKLAAETVQFFNMRDLIFEKGKRGISVIIPGIDLDQGIVKAEEFHSRLLKKLADGFSAKTDLHIGLSSRSGRLIDADRLLFESAGALEKAKKNEPVVAFRSDPEKYREFIRRTGRAD
jgi:hypothetical protein